MSIGHEDVKRQGPPEAIGRDEKHHGLFRIKITLNISPDSDWIKCFRSPSTYTYGEAHPKFAEIRRMRGSSYIEFRSSKEHLKGNVEWMDKYINQANECYHRKMTKKEEEMKRQEAKAAKEKEELEKINKMLEEL